MQNLVAASHYEHGEHSGRTSNQGTSNDEGVVQKVVNKLDEKYNVKALKKVWKPRLELVIRGMLVATFAEDSYGTVMTFKGHMEQIRDSSSLSKNMPGLIDVIACVALTVGICIQLVGSACLVTLNQVDLATKALMGWVVAQPILNAQLSNAEFMTESLTLLGGLFLLRAHLLRKEIDQEHLVSLQKQQLVGRLLLPAMYVHYAVEFLYSALTAKESDTYFQFLQDLSTMVLMIAALITMLMFSTLVAAGLKSRVVALLLALGNLVLVMFTHPFFLMVSRKDGEWKYDVSNYSLPRVALPDDYVLKVDELSHQFYEFHRYYFFLGLSSSAALLLLAQLGPGEMAIQTNEVLLPVSSRGKD